MEFLNLSLLQFGVALGSIAAFSVALYLLDRNRRKQVVATLRFWVMPGQPAPVTRRRRIQQPLSLLMQLLGMLLLLLAIAELQFGNPLARRRDHVLVLDNSAWMGAALPGRQGATLMDMGRANAIAWLRAVPSSDRVLLVRANGLATPATAWELDHRKIVKAILETEPGVTVLSLSQSLQFARNLQRQSGSTSGEVVYVGPGRITKQEAATMAVPQASNLRILPVDDPVENVGLRSVGEGEPVGDGRIVNHRSFQRRQGLGRLMIIQQQSGGVRNDSGIIRELLVDCNRFRYLMRLLKRTCQFQRRFFVSRILRGLLERRQRFGKLSLFHQRAPQTQLGGRRFRINCGHCAKMGLGLSRLSRIQQRLRIKHLWTSLGGFRFDRIVQRFGGVRTFSVAQQQSPQIQVGLVQARLQFKRFTEFRNGFGIFMLLAQREGQIEVREVIRRVCHHSLAEEAFGRARLIGIERFQPLVDGIVGL